MLLIFKHKGAFISTIHLEAMSSSAHLAQDGRKSKEWEWLGLQESGVIPAFLQKLLPIPIMLI